MAGVVNAPDRDGFVAGNIDGTRSVLVAAEAARVRRVVHVSSLAAREPALSSYGWIAAHSTTDFSIGLGRKDQAFDVSVVVKNLFNDQTPLGRTWNTYIPAPPRWIGLAFTGKL